MLSKYKSVLVSSIYHIQCDYMHVISGMIKCDYHLTCDIRNFIYGHNRSIGILISVDFEDSKGYDKWVSHVERH